MRVILRSHLFGLFTEHVTVGSTYKGIAPSLIFKQELLCKWAIVAAILFSKCFKPLEFVRRNACHEFGGRHIYILFGMPICTAIEVSAYFTLCHMFRFINRRRFGMKNLIIFALGTLRGCTLRAVALFLIINNIIRQLPVYYFARLRHGYALVCQCVGRLIDCRLTAAVKRINHRFR